MKTTDATTKNIIDYLNFHGHEAHRNHTTGVAGRKLAKRSCGVGDILCCAKGKWLEIEVKTGQDKPRPDQLARQARILKAGGEYYFVETFDDFLILAQQRRNWL